MDFVVEHRSVQNEVVRLHGRRQDIEEGDLLHRLDRFNFFVKKEVQISDIDLNEFSVDVDKVEAFKQMFLATGACPPIVFDSIDGSVIDGIHRANALAELGESKIEAFVGVEEHEFVGWVRYPEDEQEDYCE
jgi:hypothetical protein